MFFSIPLLLAWSTVTIAKPLRPSKIVRQDPAEPSTFPLGDACGNEWRYLNFDPENETDKVRLQKLHDVICMGELRAVAARGFSAASQATSTIIEVYETFFDSEEDTPAIVNEVLTKIAGESTADGMIGPVVGTMIIDNLDFGQGTDTNCGVADTQAYTMVHDGGDGREKIHFCDDSYDIPTAGPDIDCSSLDTWASEKIDTFSRLALHETLHYKTVGEDSALEGQIVDQKNEDGQVAYGPERAHGLNDPEQDAQPGKAESNADNYAYMSIAGWVGYLCSPEDQKDNWHKYFPDDPPDYR